MVRPVPRFSIIIPTAFAKTEELLKPCCESIVKHTDLSDVEVIVICNGCTDGAEEYVASLGEPFRAVSFPEAIGYTKAMNVGFAESKGEFVIPFNNDNQLLRDGWIEMLLAPFSDPQVMASGPWKNWCPWAERDFLIFFCVMIRRSVFNEIGLLDMIFSPGYGEDSDFCCRIEDAGFKVAACDVTHATDDPSMTVGNFPIYHAGNRTFRNWPGGEQLLEHNRGILAQRYGSNISRAKQCDGYMSDNELRWLSRAARKAKTVIEGGSWHAKSSRAIADNLPLGGRLYCVDTWNGSLGEQDNNHASAKWLNGDHAIDEFSRNMWNHIEAGRVIPLRMNTRNAAKLLKDKGVKADLIFIDADHTYEGCKEDIANFLPLLFTGGTIAGHDFWHAGENPWPGVAQAVDEVFTIPDIYRENFSIWEARVPVYDCFTFFNELDLLEIRLNELDSVVDRFVIAEAAFTHQGDPKPLYFEENKERYAKFLHKITHIVVPFENLTPGDEVWSRERMQRDALMQGIPEHGYGWAIISDIDEIPSADAVRRYRGEGIGAFDMRLSYYFLNCFCEHTWREAKITTLPLLREMRPCNVRYAPGDLIENGGFHLSYMGGEAKVREKIRSFAHHEYRSTADDPALAERIESGADPYGRDFEKFKFEPASSFKHFPYVIQNLNKLIEANWVKL